MQAELVYLFRHAMVREAAYELQPLSERAKLHLRALAVLEAAGAFSAAELAQHARLAQGAEGADAGALQASELRWLWRAAEDASAGFQFELSSRFFSAIGAHAAETPARRASAWRNAGHVFHFMGRPREGRPLLEQAIVVAREHGLRRELGVALSSLALALEHTGQVEQAEAMQLEALQICREVGNHEGEIAALTNMGNLRVNSRVTLAEANLREALELARAHADLRTQGRIYASLAGLMRMTGRMEESERAYREVLQLFRGIGDVASEALVIGNYAIVLQQTGRLDEAQEMYEQSLRMQRQLGARYFEALVLGNMAILQMLRAMPAEAEPLFRQSLALRRELGDRRGEADALSNLANMLADTGRPAEAVRKYEQALALDRTTGNRRGEGTALCGLGSVRRVLGSPAEAEALLTQGLALLREVGASSSEAGALCELGLCRLQRGDPHAGATWLEGARMLARLGDQAELELRTRAMTGECAKAGVAPFALKE
jgi:tetratricopeptide (TPR) repeat protein